MQLGLSPVSIIHSLSSRDKWAAISEVIDCSPALAGSRSTELKSAVLARERTNSTAVGRGIALSHGELKGLSSMQIAVGLSRYGIEFGAVDRKPVHLLFVFATPPEQRSEYLQALATICRLGRQNRFEILWKGAADRDIVERTMNLSFSPLH